MTDEGSNRLEVLDNLIARFEAILNEINIYKDHLVAVNRGHTVRFGAFDSTVKQDLTHLKKLRESNSAESGNVHGLFSSNIPFFETTWNVAKQSTGLVAFRKKFFWSTPPARWRQKDAKPGKQAAGRDHGIQVDVVTENGTEWIKVNSLTERRLQHDIAKEGWGESDVESEDDLDASEDRDDGLGEDTSIPILKLAYDLMRAARTNRTRYQWPKVRMILPRMTEQSPLVHKVLDRIRQTGVELHLGPTSEAPPSIHDALPNLLRLNENYVQLTPVLNMDTTVMLALISDISHGRADQDGLRHPLQLKQFHHEKTDQLLPTILYPALGNRALVCTHEAMGQMQSIVAPVANDNEKRRAALLFTSDPHLDAETRASRRAEFAALSTHALPPTFQMPITVIAKDAPAPAARGYSAAVAAKIAPRFADHNASVFLHGWRTGRTTLTSNWTTVKHVEDAIERARLELIGAGELSDADYVSGPGVWFIPLSRSLAGMDHGDLYLGQDRLELYKLQTARSREGYRYRRRAQGSLEHGDQNEQESVGAEGGEGGAEAEEVREVDADGGDGAEEKVHVGQVVDAGVQPLAVDSDRADVDTSPKGI